MANNEILGKAKIAKNDEFYTQYEDIQTEMNHYTKHFENKTVLCNCDDPFESNFCKFFLRNFNYLRLKRLICTSYSGSSMVGTQLSLFDDEEMPIGNKHGYLLDVSSVPMENGRGVSDKDIENLLKSNRLKKLKGNGDFRSEECLNYLKEADIVITNPPFSMFREYISQLTKYNKHFIIIGNMNALHYKEVFPLVKDNKLWLGASIHSGDREFRIPPHYETASPSLRTDENGWRYVRVPGVRWFTNLDNEQRHEKIILYKHYSPEEYPTYDNFNAINVNKYSEIPDDYYGIIGVPDTFIDHYNPEQFEILGRSGDTDWVLNECDFFTPPPDDVIQKYKRMNKTWRVQNAYLVDENETPIIVYSRIFIKRKEGIS